MTKIGDERIAFYLENRRQIDEWARLKTEAVDAVYAVFQQLGEKLEAAVSGLDGAPLLMPFLESSYPAYALIESSWPPAEPDRRVPVGVTLEMHRGELLSGPSVPKIYLGIRTERSLPGSKDLHTALRAACGEQNFYATSYWPSLRYVPSPTDRWWEDRQAFEQTLVGGLVKAWDDLAPLVRTALKALDASPSG